MPVPRRLDRAALLLVVVLVAACGSKVSDDRTACTPGVSIPCTGIGGCSGGQFCRDDGSGYEGCQCGDIADSGTGTIDSSTSADSSGDSISTPPDTLVIDSGARPDVAPSDSTACTPGAKDCVGNTPRVCDSTNSWRELASCFGSTPRCKDGACTTVCESGEYRCSPSNTLDRCNADLTGWEVVLLCALGPCDAVGKECDECVSGEKGCAGTVPRTCDATGHWTSATTACSGTTPYCSAGACVASTLVQYSQSFTKGVVSGPGTSQCSAWSSFRSTLSTGTYTKITLSGSEPGEVTCSGAKANTLCLALASGTPTEIVCDTRSWRVAECSGGGGSNWEISAGGSATCACWWGWAVRPCMGTANWGGFSTDVCDPPSQTLTVKCE